MLPEKSFHTQCDVLMDILVNGAPRYYPIGKLDTTVYLHTIEDGGNVGSQTILLCKYLTGIHDRHTQVIQCYISEDKRVGHYLAKIDFHADRRWIKDIFIDIFAWNSVAMGCIEKHRFEGAGINVCLSDAMLESVCKAHRFGEVKLFEKRFSSDYPPSNYELWATVRTMTAVADELTKMKELFAGTGVPSAFDIEIE